MARYGSEASGFSVELNGSLLLLRGWGFWDAEVAAQLVPGVLSLCPALAIRPLRLVCDFGQLKPQDDGGQQALTRLLGALSQRGVNGAAIQVTNTITRMQLKSITKELPRIRWVYIGTQRMETDQMLSQLEQEERK